MESRRMVVVTTDEKRRGVFAGVLKEYDKEKGIAVLENARMAIYWSAETRGVLGLAANGPQSGSRISPAVPRIEINGVTSIQDMTPRAIETWEKEPWD